MHIIYINGYATIMTQDNKYVLKTDKEERELHYVRLAAEDEKGWKRINLLSLNGIDLKYKKIEIRINANTEINTVKVSEINKIILQKRDLITSDVILTHISSSILDLSEETDIHIYVSDIFGKIIDDWDLEIRLYSEAQNMNQINNNKIRKRNKIYFAIFLILLLCYFGYLFGHHSNTIPNFYSSMYYTTKD